MIKITPEVEVFADEVIRCLESGKTRGERAEEKLADNIIEASQQLVVNLLEEAKKQV